MTTKTISIEIAHGTIWRFPFDRYAAMLTIAVHPTMELDDTSVVPFRLTVWKHLPAWQLDIGAVRLSPQDGAIELSFGVRRPALHVIVATAIYASMMVLAITGLAISLLFFLGIRRVEATLIAALAAMLFTLPSLRNLMPGGAPVGGAADLVILFGAEVALILSLALAIFTWATRSQSG